MGCRFVTTIEQFALIHCDLQLAPTTHLSHQRSARRTRWTAFSGRFEGVDPGKRPASILRRKRPTFATAVAG